MFSLCRVRYAPSVWRVGSALRSTAAPSSDGGVPERVAGVPHGLLGASFVSAGWHAG